MCAQTELLVELGDDLADYEDDVAANSFNVYRCFLAMYGEQDGQAQLTAFIQEVRTGARPLTLSQ